MLEEEELEPIMQIKLNNSYLSPLQNKVIIIFFVLGVALFLINNTVWANNLVISNLGVVEMDTGNNIIKYKCDVSWENSWRDTNNHDAVWVFLKYSLDGGATWNHASMAESGVNLASYLYRHVSGDWGDTCEEDKVENDFSLRHGYRIFSVYHTPAGSLWIITEADRSATTFLMPSEY